MEVDNTEQRRFPRYQYSIPLKYRVKEEHIPTFTVTRDISTGGLKIVTNKYLPRGTSLHIEIEVPPKHTINAVVTNVWSRRIDHSEQYLSGTKFSEINKFDEKNIQELVKYALKH